MTTIKTEYDILCSDPDTETPTLIEDGMSVLVLAGRYVQIGGRCYAFGQSVVELSGGELTASDSVSVIQTGGVCTAIDYASIHQSGGHSYASGYVHVRLLGGKCLYTDNAIVDHRGGEAMFVEKSYDKLPAIL